MAQIQPKPNTGLLDFRPAVPQRVAAVGIQGICSKHLLGPILLRSYRAPFATRLSSAWQSSGATRSRRDETEQITICFDSLLREMAGGHAVRGLARYCEGIPHHGEGSQNRPHDDYVTASHVTAAGVKFYVCDDYYMLRWKKCGTIGYRRCCLASYMQAAHDPETTDTKYALKAARRPVLEGG